MVHGAKGKKNQAGNSQRQHKNIDHHQIKRKYPARDTQIPQIVIFNHGHMKLPRQQHYANGRNADHGQCGQRVGCFGDDLRDGRVLQRMTEQITKPVEHAEGDEQPDTEKGQQLDNGLCGYGQHQPVLMFGGVNASGSKGNGETRQNQHGGKANIRQVGAACALNRRNHSHERGGDGLQLQRDIRHNADQCDQRHKRRYGFRFAIAGGNKIRDGGDILRFGQRYNALKQSLPEYKHQNRADINQQKTHSLHRGHTHRAEKCPGCAVNAERESINQRATTPSHQLLAIGVAKMRKCKQSTQIEQRAQENNPGCNHASVLTDWPLSFWGERLTLLGRAGCIMSLMLHKKAILLYSCGRAFAPARPRLRA